MEVKKDKDVKEDKEAKTKTTLANEQRSIKKLCKIRG